MVLPMPAWGIREVLMLLVALVWTGVTLMLAWRGNTVVESLEWWGILVAPLLGIWKIFAPPAPPSSGGGE